LHLKKVKELTILFEAWTKRAGVSPFETLGKGSGE